LLSDYGEEIFWANNMGRKFSGLTTRSIERMTFELAIKMILSVHFQYRKEEHA
jgi:hypothetical protein